MLLFVYQVYTSMVQPRITGLHNRYMVEYWFAQPKIDMNDDKVWVKLEAELKEQGLLLPVEAIKYHWLEVIDQNLVNLCRVKVKDRTAFGWKNGLTEEEQWECLGSRLEVLRKGRRQRFGISSLLEEWDPCEDILDVDEEPFSTNGIGKVPTLFSSRTPGAISIDVPGFKLPVQAFRGYEFLVLREEEDIVDHSTAAHIEYLIKVHGGVVRDKVSEIKKCGLVFECKCPNKNLEAFCKVEGKIYRRQALFDLLSNSKDEKLQSWHPSKFDEYCWQPDLEKMFGDWGKEHNVVDSDSSMEDDIGSEDGDIMPCAEVNFLKFEVVRLRLRHKKHKFLRQRVGQALLSTALELTFLWSDKVLLSQTIQNYNCLYNTDGEVNEAIIMSVIRYETDWKAVLESSMSNHTLDKCLLSRLLLLIDRLKRNDQSTADEK